jgi:hypothetical protein
MQNDIDLYIRTSGWVEICNVSKSNYTKTIDFLNRNRKYFDLVSFGYGPIPSLAIKNERIAKFISYALKNGVVASVATPKNERLS